LGQLANFEGVAEIIRDYQKWMQPCMHSSPACRGEGRVAGLQLRAARALCVCCAAGCAKDCTGSPVCVAVAARAKLCAILFLWNRFTNYRSSIHKLSAQPMTC
jgi:hypothetical protein